MNNKKKKLYTLTVQIAVVSEDASHAIQAFREAIESPEENKDKIIVHVENGDTGVTVRLPTHLVFY